MDSTKGSIQNRNKNQHHLGQPQGLESFSEILKADAEGLASQVGPSLDWLQKPEFRPYVFCRDENRILNPGSRHDVNWFRKKKPLTLSPLNLANLPFAEAIYHIEERAFGPANMAMPRWVFYDCAVIPGFVAGFCAQYSALGPKGKATLKKFEDMEWIPVSLFIIIPTMHSGEWVAHNLCSVNSLLPKEEQFYGLGFLSKAFGLWYANVQLCAGMTQWGSPSLKLHSHYGPLEIIGAYAPVHQHPNTVTYRVKLDPNDWALFFTRQDNSSFEGQYSKTEHIIHPKEESTMIALQKEIENGKGPFFLSGQEVRNKGLDEALCVFQPKVGKTFKSSMSN